MKKNTKLVLQFGLTIILWLIITYSLNSFIVEHIFSPNSEVFSSTGQVPPWANLLSFGIDLVISLILGTLVIFLTRKQLVQEKLDNERIVTVDTLAIGIAIIGIALIIVQPPGIFSVLLALVFILSGITAIPILLINLFKILQTHNLKWYILGISLQAVYIIMLVLEIFAAPSM